MHAISRNVGKENQRAELSGERGEGRMMKSKTQSKATKRKLEIQTLAEKILKKHNLDASKDFYLKLSMPPYQD